MSCYPSKHVTNIVHFNLTNLARWVADKEIEAL